ncbi:amidase signature enzyme [Bimuria novae-zelandiae CBS 107.79]|uniref:Amidase signature enzyme n=1 Tax=Bimuria novae-zelandiae CBS 107.79 TaxID=1447943 RepID=A0A6A5UXZ0_9PLEO|nr:amidase signature enzyme [Bimuria novae-zelandiae CBS 107.79]
MWVTCDWVKSQVEMYTAVDHVFDEACLQTIYIQSTSSIESGLFHRPNEDDYQASMNGILPDSKTHGFRYALVSTMSEATLGIPVPSRLYYNSTSPFKPLDGVRVTVKDIIDISGIKTTNGNRAWAKLYPPLNKTAPAIQTLIDLGAVMSGKTKTAQFTNSDCVTADWVDYHGAFNPRGDGYQDPGVSSTGAGAATAAYDWVDVSIGTDTGGSVRIPASKNGLVALRPSFGATLNDGIMPESTYFDAIGFMTRSPYTLQSFGTSFLTSAAYALNLTLTRNHTTFPRHLIVPSNLWPVANNAPHALFSSWITALATKLNATISTTSIREFWNATAHADHSGTEFSSHLQQVGFSLNWKNQHDHVIAPFKRDYAAAYNGRTPAINPVPAARYKSAENITDADVAESYSRFAYFPSWFGEHVVRSHPSSCSESLFLIPMFDGEPSYRNNVYVPPDVVCFCKILLQRAEPRPGSRFSNRVSGVCE